MGCIQGLRILIGERPYPAQPEVDEPPVVVEEIMPSKSERKNQRKNGKSNEEPEKRSEKNNCYDRKLDNINDEKQNGFKDGLTTDAIPVRNVKTKKSFLSSLSSSTCEIHDLKDDDCVSEQDELDKKYSIPSPEVLVDEPKDSNFEHDKRSYSSSSKTEDEEDVASEMDEDEGKTKRKKKKSKLMLVTSRLFKPKHKGPPDPERCIGYSVSPSQQQYFISHSKNIHIGPTYEQKIIVNHVNNGPRPDEAAGYSRSAVEETEAIRAIKDSYSPLTREVLEYISNEIGHRWRAMGRQLGYSNGRMDGFEINFHDHSERVYQLLLEWTQDQTENATLATLSRALWRIEAREAVQGLAEYLSAKSPD